MNRRRLSKKQSERIKKNQQSQSASVNDKFKNSNIHRGQVISHKGKTVEVESIDDKGERLVVSCYFRANLQTIATGDFVSWQKEDERGVVVSLEERTTLLQRPDSYGKLRPAAANISQLVLVFAHSPPAYHGLIDRYLVAAENLKVKTLLVINKSDMLDNQGHASLIELADAYSALGYPTLFVSAHNGDGFEELQEHLNEETSIFAGQSGVGKSSLIQSLLPREEINIGDLSKAADKGKHTTTHSRLYHFSSGGSCIDSPGIREFGLWHLNKAEVLDGFVDLREFANNCKFRNCEHEAEPKCGIKEALEQGKLYKWRFDSYKHILGSLDDVSIKKDKYR